MRLGAGLLHQLLFMAMELCWVVGLLLLGGRQEAIGMGPNLPYAAALYPLAFVCGIALRLVVVQRAGWPAAAALGAVGVATAAAALTPVGALHAEIAGRGWLAAATASPALAVSAFALCGGLAWARGWMLSARRVDAAGFASGFQNGLVVLLILLLLAAGAPQAGSLTAGLVVIFLALGLLGLWHIRSTREAGRTGAGTAVVGIAAVLLVGAVFWLLVDRALLEAALRVLQWIVGSIGQALAWLAAFMPTADMPAQTPQPVSRGLADEGGFSLSEAVRMTARVIFVIVFGGFVAIALFRSLFDLLRWLRRREDGVAVAYERSTAGWADTLGHLVAWLRCLLCWRRQDPAGAAADPIRAAYADFLHRLARRGWHRKSAETPARFLERLRPAWPGEAADAAVLTQAYVTARYGPPGMQGGISGAVRRRLRSDVRKMRRNHDG